MSDIHFNCALCGHPLTIDSEGAGLAIDCPSCAKPIIVPLEGNAQRTEQPKQLKSEPSQTKASKPVQRTRSLLKTIWRSFTIGRKKTARSKMEWVDLRKAEIALGQQAFNRGLFREQHPDTYRSIETTLQAIANKNAQAGKVTSLSLTEDAKKSITGVTDKLNSYLLNGDLQNVLATFGRLIHERHGDNQELRIQINEVHRVSEQIASLDQELLALAQDTNFLVRHPALFFGTILVLCALAYGQYHNLRNQWKIRQAEQNAREATRVMAGRMEKTSLEIKERLLEVEKTRLAAQKIEAESRLRSASNSAVAREKVIGGTAASIEDKRLKALEAKAQKDQAQASLASYTESLFGSLRLDPETFADQYFGACTWEVSGEGFETIKALHKAKQWLELLGQLDRAAYAEYPSMNRIESTYNRLLDMPLTVTFRPTFGLKPNLSLYFLTFSDTDRNFQAFEINTHFQKHPTREGCFISYYLRESKIIALVGPDTYKFKSETLGAFENGFDKRVAKLRASRKLGDIDDSKLSIQTQAERKYTFEQVKEYAKLKKSL